MGETRRATIQEAARIMGVSEGAIRKRVKRNTLRHDKEADGRVYVYLEGATRGVDDRVDDVPHPDSNALISEMRDRITFLEGELQRKDAILLSMTEAMKAIAPPAQGEAPREPPGAPVTATEQPGRVKPQRPLESAQEPRESSGMHMPEVHSGPLPRDQQRASERPWWRFWR